MDKYEQIYNAVMKKAPSVVISGSFDRRDSEVLFTRYPKLQAIIAGFTVMGNGFFSKGVTIKIKYMDVAVDVDHTISANTAQEIINLMEKYVTRYDESFAVIVPNQKVFMDALNIYVNKWAPLHPYVQSIGYKIATFGAKTVIYPTINYHVPAAELKKVEAKINEEIGRVAKMLFEPGMSKLTKVLLAHNYLATIAVYDHLDITEKFNPYSHSAYGTLISHRSVCHGFADAFKRLMVRAGVKADIITGTIYGSKEHHAWNIVHISDTEVFHVDVTWDLEPRLNYRYFLKGDESMSSTRNWDRSFFPAARYDCLNYLEAKKYVLNNKEKLLAKGIGREVLFV